MNLTPRIQKRRLSRAQRIEHARLTPIEDVLFKPSGDIADPHLTAYAFPTMFDEETA